MHLLDEEPRYQINTSLITEYCSHSDIERISSCFIEMPVKLFVCQEWIEDIADMPEGLVLALSTLKHLMGKYNTPIRGIHIKPLECAGYWDYENNIMGLSVEDLYANAIMKSGTTVIPCSGSDVERIVTHEFGHALHFNSNLGYDWVYKPRKFPSTYSHTNFKEFVAETFVQYETTKKPLTSRQKEIIGMITNYFDT